MLYIIANILSGKNKGNKVLQAVKARLDELKVPYKVLISSYATESIVHARSCAQNDDCTAIAVIGGDGTINEVVTGLDGCKKPVGVIGAGTGNDFVRAAGLPTDAAAMVDVIVAGKTRYIDIIQLNSRRCVNVLGTGFDVELLERANRYRNIFKGNGSYYASLIVTLLKFKFRTFTLSIDGGAERKISAFMVSMGNGKYCGGGLPVAPNAVLDDGYIDFVMIKKFNRLLTPGLLLKFLKGGVEQMYCSEHCHCKELVLDVEPKIALNCDGELAMDYPTHVKLLPDELQIFTV